MNPKTISVLLKKENNGNLCHDGTKFACFSNQYMYTICTIIHATKLQTTPTKGCKESNASLKIMF